MAVWTKRRADAPLGAFVAEAAGLDWIRVEGGPHVPRVVDVTATALLLERVETTSPTPESAEEFGLTLSVLHSAGADAFGAPWTGFMGPVDDLLTMDNAASPTWADHFRDRRVVPALQHAYDRGHVEGKDRDDIEEVLHRLEQLVPEEPPSRLHGDLWSGNVLWSDDGVWLIDPAAHGGHRETDLAMLQLFGLPHLELVLSAYDAASPLSPGWRDRFGVHQLWPLLVHAVLFGPSYGSRAGEAARSVL